MGSMAWIGGGGDVTALRWQGKLRTLARLVTLVTLVLGARISVAQSPPVRAVRGCAGGFGLVRHRLP
jgi:hypothetical protein